MFNREWKNLHRNKSLMLQVQAIGESMCPTFVTPGDALPAGRRKVIHSVGAVGRVEWRDAGGHPYTGVFKGEDIL